ncbi:ABC transporter ATP-binding protein [Paraburkholderia sp. IW21]|uniref:ABC transporter ATP-binding protein n=1 Tax=Paraburkholderia sp. IW21 TaxID=3242488 RepID=UPI00351F9F5E
MNPVIALDGADVFYGSTQALYGVSIAVRPGETVALVGRNGAGKSTALRALMGLLPCRRGRRLIDGMDGSLLGPEAVNRLGVAYVPEDRQVFSNLTVEENLRIASFVRRRCDAPQWSLDEIWTIFPRLFERRSARGQTLSGGEQQMLALGRALLCNPRAILLDEPTEGLAPLVVGSLVTAMKKIADSGVATILVEQNFVVPGRIADRFLIMDNGVVKWSGDRASFFAQRENLENLLSV